MIFHFLNLLSAHMARRFRRVRRVRRRVRRNRRGLGSRARRSYRRSGGTNTIAPMRNLGYLLPRRLRVKLPYNADSANFTSSQCFDERVFKGNDLHDPDSTLVGHQPMLFDNLMAMYSQFYVSKSKFQCWISPAMDYTAIGYLAGKGNCGTVCIAALGSASPVTSTASLTAMEILEQSYVIKRRQWGMDLAGPKSNYISATRSNREIRPDINTYSTGAYGTASGPPTSQWYWHVIALSADANTIAAGFPSYLNGCWRCRVVYYCEFSNMTFEDSS